MLPVERGGVKRASSHANRKTSSFWSGARQNGFAETHTLSLQAIEQAPRPDKFSSEKPQTEDDSNPAGPGGKNHDGTDEEQRKAAQYLKEALRLTNRIQEH